MSQRHVSRGGRSVRAGALVLAFLTVFVVPGSPLADAAPTIAVTPSTGLHDGDVAVAHIIGLSAGEDFFVEVCERPEAGIGDRCRSLRRDTADDAGALDAPVRVRAIIDAGDFGNADCRTITTCVLRARRLVADPPFGPDAAVTFDPTSGVAPPPSATVQPTTGLRPGDPLTVAGTGFNPSEAVRVYTCIGSAEQGGGRTPWCLDDRSVSGRSDALGGVSMIVPFEPYTTVTPDAFSLPDIGRPCLPEAGCYVIALSNFAEQPLVETVQLGSAPPPAATPPTPQVGVTPRFTG